MRPARRGLLAAGIVAALGLLALSRAGICVRFAPRVISPASDVVAPFNALGNAQDDFAVLNGRALVQVRIMDGEPRAVGQLNLPEGAGFAAALDVDGDGLDELCVGLRDSSGAWALALGREASLPMRFGPERDSLGPDVSHRDCWVGPATVLASPGRARGLACGIYADRHRPRGVALYDVATRARRWFYPMGAWPQDIVAANLGRGESSALLVGTASTQNGLTINGTDDRHAGVVALDAAGRRLWQAVLAEDFARVRVLELPAQAQAATRVVAAVHSHRAQNPQPCTLAILDGRDGGVLRRIDFPHSLGQPHLLDASRGTFVVGGADGMMRTFDRDLRPLARWNAGSSVEAWGCVDLAGDGTKCVIASTDCDVLVLDAGLGLLGRFARLGAVARDPLELKLARAGLRNWRLVTAHGKAMVLDLHPVPPLADPLRVAGVLGLAAITGIVAASWRRRPRKLLSGSESREFLVDYRQVRHDILDDVRPFGALWNWAHEAVAGAALPRDVFERARGEFLEIGLGTLRRFIGRAEAMCVDEDRVDRMRALTSEMEVLLRTPAGESPAETSQRARDAAHTMRELSDACAAAYRDVVLHTPCQADREVHDVLHALHASLMERRIAVHAAIEPSATVPVLFDAGELRALLAQLIENAATALLGREDARLRVTAALDSLDQRRVVIRVLDNGPGIPVESREAVFRPDVSSRAGGGFGLGHAREVARSWRGDLVIEEAPEGGGASLRLVLVVLFPFETGGDAAPVRGVEGRP